MKTYICPDCGTVGSPKLITPGSILVEAALWCLLIVPGVIYSAWRHAARRKGCRECGARVISTDTPRGQAMLQQYHGAHEIAA